jgi:phage terminase Nu1 subunit (DNA packaging protein)
MIKELPKRGRGERPKTPASEALNRERTELTKTRRQQAEILLAKARGELITKQLVERQAAYLLVAMRQKILGIPQTYSRRLLNISDQKEMAAKLKEMALSVLNEIKDLPSRVSDPNWLQTLEGDGS